MFTENEIRFRAEWWRFHRRPILAASLLNEALWLIDEFIPDMYCEECQAHFIELVEKYPPALTSRSKYFRWGYFLHDLISQQIHRPRICLGRAAKIYCSKSLFPDEIDIETDPICLHIVFAGGNEHQLIDQIQKYQANNYKISLDVKGGTSCYEEIPGLILTNSINELDLYPDIISYYQGEKLDPCPDI